MSNEKSQLEETLLLHIKAAKLPLPEREYRFSKKRRFRSDFAWPAQKLLVECEGGIYTKGRHVRPQGYEKDCIKYNLAMLEGWNVARFSSGMIKSGEAIKTIELFLR